MPPLLLLLLLPLIYVADKYRQILLLTCRRALIE